MPTEWRGLGEGQGWRRHTAGARSAHGAQLTTGSANLAPCMRVDKRMAQAHGERRVLNKTTTFSEVNRRLLCARLWVPSINPILYYCEPGASGRGSVSVHSPQPLFGQRGAVLPSASDWRGKRESRAESLPPKCPLGVQRRPEPMWPRSPGGTTPAGAPPPAFTLSNSAFHSGAGRVPSSHSGTRWLERGSRTARAATGSGSARRRS